MRVQSWVGVGRREQALEDIQKLILECRFGEFQIQIEIISKTKTREVIN